MDAAELLRLYDENEAVTLVIGLPVVLATAFIQNRRAEPESAESPKPAGPEGAVADREARPFFLFTWRNSILGGVLAFCLLFGFAGLYVVIKDRVTKEEEDTRKE